MKTSMTYRQAAAAAVKGTVADVLNPCFLLGQAASSLLADVVAGRIDVVALAKIELAARGLNVEGVWDRAGSKACYESLQDEVKFPVETR